LAASRLGAALIAISPDGNFLAGSVDAVISDGMGVSGGGKLIHIDMAKLSSALASTSGSQWPESTRAEWQFTQQTDAESAPATLSIPEDVFRARILQRAMLKGVGGDCWLCVADIRSEIGFSAILESLWCGGSIVFSHGSFEDDGAAIALFEADRMFVTAGAVPEYFRTFENSGYRGVHPRTIVVAGSSFDEDALLRVRRRVSPHLRVHLDCPETGTIAVSAPWQAGAAKRYWAIPGVKLRVAGPEGKALGNDMPGMIEVKSEVSIGPAGSDQFRDGWFCSALSGALSGNGSFVLG